MRQFNPRSTSELPRDHIYDNMVSTHTKLQQFYKECQTMATDRRLAILAADAKIGCWYEDGRGLRHFCFNTEDASGQAGFVVYEKSKDTFYCGWSSSNRLTPLPDCDSWEWEPTPTYRPFTLQEIVERKDRVWVRKGLSFRLQLVRIELEEGDNLRQNRWVFIFKRDDEPDRVRYQLDPQQLLDLYTFDDGTPCGVEV